MESTVLEAFQRAARRVPAYRRLLEESAIVPATVTTLADFERLPVLEKRDTFARFGIADLCLDGDLGALGAVLTSSGHSGTFAFGLTGTEAMAAAPQGIDDLLDYLFSVRSRRTLLINCLPMGVKVPTLACTLAETSVRPDMAIGLVKAFGPHYAQIILVGEAAFLKNVLEAGKRAGVRWATHRVHVIVGEEPLAENARAYLQGLLGHDPQHPDHGSVLSSMGIAEVGLNLLAEAPPAGLLVALRRILHLTPSLRAAVFPELPTVPSLFVFDPRRLNVEFDRTGRLILTTLDPAVRVPLIRYAPGDIGGWLRLPAAVRPALEAAGLPCAVFDTLPAVFIQGRGEHAQAGSSAVYPEAVKEGLYHDPELAELTTANFRLVSGPEKVRIRIQLAPGQATSPALEERFHQAISHYVTAPVVVSAEEYAGFGSGMALDYERKFSYLGA